VPAALRSYEAGSVVRAPYRTRTQYNGNSVCKYKKMIVEIMQVVPYSRGFVTQFIVMQVCDPPARLCGWGWGCFIWFTPCLEHTGPARISQCADGRRPD